MVPESEDKVYYPSDDTKRDAHVSDFNSYLALYRKSLENPEGRSSTFVQRLKLGGGLPSCNKISPNFPCTAQTHAACSTYADNRSVSAFWKEIAEEFFWKNPPTGPVMQYNFDSSQGSIYVKCMEGAKTNVCYNVVDRLVSERNLGDKVAFYW